MACHFGKTNNGVPVIICTRGNKPLNQEDQKAVNDCISRFEKRHSVKGGENHDESSFSKRQVD